MTMLLNRKQQLSIPVTFYKNAQIPHLQKLLCCLAFCGILCFAQDLYCQTPTPIYPKLAGYVGIVHPLASFSEEGTTKNFDRSYTAGLPLGINIWKSPRIGFSLEFVPYIRAENGTSKTSNLLIHPGVLVALGHGFTFAGRAAFETSGRYGFTPVINKVIVKNRNSSYFVAVPFPVRFGNDHPTSAAVAFQFGIAF